MANVVSKRNYIIDSEQYFQFHAPLIWVEFLRIKHAMMITLPGKVTANLPVQPQWWEFLEIRKLLKCQGINKKNEK